MTEQSAPGTGRDGKVNTQGMAPSGSGERPVREPRS